MQNHSLTASDPAPADVDQWNLPGINISEGVRRMMNKPALYQKILQDFYHRFHGEIDRIQQHLSCGDIASAIRCAHSLKSLSGSIGANTLSDLSQTLERSIKQSESISPALSDTRAEHHRVMLGIAQQFSLNNPLI